MNISQYYIWIPATHTVPVFRLLTMTNRSNQVNGLVMTNLTFLFTTFLHRKSGFTQGRM